VNDRQGPCSLCRMPSQVADAFLCGHPNSPAAFSVFQEIVNKTARKAIRRCKNIDPSLMYMHNAPVRCPDPQTAVAIAKHFTGLELLRHAQGLVGLGPATDESLDSPADADEKRAVVVFTKCPDAVYASRHWIEMWGTGIPPPQPIQHSRPEIAFAVLIQSDHSDPKAAVLSMALYPAILNRAELPVRSRKPVHPYQALTIFKKPVNVVPGKFRVLREFAIFPTSKPFRGSNPKSPVPRGE